jgi:hypothetical protein
MQGVPAAEGLLNQREEIAADRRFLLEDRL